MAIGGMMVKVGSEFEASMSRLGAVTDASGEEFDALTDKAMEMGAGTKYSAKEAADAMTELAKAGMNTEQTMAAIPGVLSMAATENMELATAAEIVSAALNSYSMEAEDATNIANVLAKNSNMSASGVESLAAALRPVAGFASEVGIEFTTLNAVLGILSNNGLDGAVAGQKLNSILRSMSAPTKKAREAAEDLGLTFFDMNGTMKPLPQIIDEINAATEGMGDQQKMAALKTMFGSDAIAAMLPLLRTGGEEIANYSSELKDSAGYADETAAAMNNNLLGALTELSSALETAGIAMYKHIGPALTTIVRGITDLVSAFATAPPWVHKLALVLGTVLAALGPTILAVVTVTNLMTRWATSAAMVAQGTAKFGTLLTFLGGSTFIAVAAILAIIAVVVGLIAYWDEVVAATKVVGQWLVKLGGWLKEVGIAFLDLMSIIGEKAVAGFSKFGEKLNELNPIFGVIGEKMSSFASTISEGFITIKDKVSQALSDIGTNSVGFFSSIKNGASEAFSSMGNSISTFFSSIGSNLSGAFSGVSSVFGTIAGLVGNYVGGIIEKVLDLAGGFQTLITSGDFTPLINAIANLFPMILGLFLGGTPGLVYAGFRLIGAIATGMGLSIPELINQVTDIIVSAIEAFSEALPGFIETGTEMLLSLVEGFVMALPGIINAVTSVITTITEALVVFLPALLEIGMNILISIIEGLLAALPQIIMVGIQIITALITAFVSLIPAILEIGITILQVIIEGLVTILPMLIETWISIFSTLIEVFISLIPTIIDTGIILMTSLIDSFISVLPAIIDAGISLLMALIEGIISILPKLIEAGIKLMISLLEAILKALPQLISAGIKILMSLIEGIVSIIPILIQTALQLIFAIVKALIGALPQIISAGMQILMALIKGIISVLPSLISAALQLIAGIVKVLIQAIPQLLSAGVNLIKALIRGVLSLLGAVGSASLNIGKTIFNKIKSINLLQVGKDLIRGLWNGISDMAGWIKGKISGFASGITDSIKGFFGIHSPSRLWRDEIGKMLPQGMVVGMEMEENDLLKASKRLVEIATPNMGPSPIPISTQSKQTQLIDFGYSSQQSSEDYSNDEPLIIEVPVNLDGREVAKIISPYMDKQLRAKRDSKNRANGGW